MATGDTKTCARCGRTIEWRRKWADDWDNVKYCSKSCRKHGVRDIDHQLESTTLRLLNERGPSKSICPSEAARAVADNPNDDDAWRDLMEPARMAARRLTARGIAEITQKGKPVDPSTAKGPIRVQLKR